MGSLRAAAVLAVVLLAQVGSAGGASPPFRPTGGLAFGPAAPVDPAGTSVQANLALGDDGTIWLSSSTIGRTEFVHRSSDGGRSFRAAARTGVGPQGDTAIAVGDGGIVYSAAEDSGSGIGLALSTDGGATWTSTRFLVAGALDGRPSLAVDRGATPSPADDTVFLVVHYNGGAYLYSSPGGGLDFVNAAGGQAIGVGPCGALVFDRVQRNLYLPCASGVRVAAIAGHVPLGQRVGLIVRTFVTPLSPGGGSVTAILPVVTVDAAGTVYAVWVDRNDHNVYYAASPDGGASWRGPVRVNGNEARSTALPVAVAGAPGVLAIAWLGADSSLAAAAMPAFSAHAVEATAFRWFGYAAVVTGAASAGQGIVQQRFTAKPIHFGRIPDGSLGDYIAAALGPDGGLVLAYDDTTSQHHAAHVFVTRQLAGPTPLASSISEPADSNPVTDPQGDASPPQLDLRRVEPVQDEPTRLRVLMTLAAPPAPVDYRLEERIGRTTGNGRHIVGSGSIRGAVAGRATFRVNVFQAKTGQIVFSDPRAHVAFRSQRITRVRILGRRKARIWATGANGASCVATFTDGGSGRRSDSVTIAVGRYRRSGPLLSGGVTIR